VSVYVYMYVCVCVCVYYVLNMTVNVFVCANLHIFDDTHGNML
jgi:hypothetical protein